MIEVQEERKIFHQENDLLTDGQVAEKKRHLLDRDPLKRDTVEMTTIHRPEKDLLTAVAMNGERSHPTARVIVSQ